MEKKRILGIKKRIALVAHDHKKKELLDWVKHNKKILGQHELYGTGTTGKLISGETDLSVQPMKSGPMGGDLQIGSMIAEGKLEVLIFFWDPMEAQPHDPDIRALLRICSVWNIPLANNRSTADFIITSPLFNEEYKPYEVDYSKYMHREVKG